MEESTESVQEGTAVRQTVVFLLSDESYGVDIARVSEIIRLQQITPVPRAEKHVMGLVNLRGKTIPVVNLRNRLQMEDADTTESSRIIVMEAPEGNVGMIVDAVTEVVSLLESDIEPAPEVVTELSAEYVEAVAKREGRLVTLLALDKVLAA